jgi:D-alanine-D-alanine ligase
MPLDVLLLHNTPALPVDHPDYASEAGVLESVEAVTTALESAGHRVRTIGIRDMADFLAEVPRLGQPDVVFNLFEGFAGVGSGEALVAGWIEAAGLPLTGSDAAALELVRDKARVKWLLRGAGLPTADFVLVAPDRPQPRLALAALLAGGPVIVKPAHEDASLGIGPHSVVSDAAALDQQIDQVRADYGPVLVERFIAGREFNAAVIALPEPRLLPLAEIEFARELSAHERLVTYAAKWAAGSAADLATAPRCPARVDQQLARRIEQVALAALEATGCRDYARVDLRVAEDESIYILEVNGNPDIGPSAGFARALAAAGISYGEFVELLVRHAAGRLRIVDSTDQA